MHPFAALTLLTGLLAASPAAASPHGTQHLAPVVQKRGPSRESRMVYFHKNDSRIAVTPSTSWDVFSFAAHAPVDGSLAPASTSCTEPGCVDGPQVNYTVVVGDTLEAIAATFNSGVCDIATLNNIANPNFILAGQALVIPTELCEPDNASCITPPGTRPCVPASELNGQTTVVVASGDTFTIIGQRFNVTAEAVAAANPCVVATALEIGQTLNLPVCPDCPAA